MKDLARTLAEKWRRCCGSDDLCQELERDIREAIEKTLESQWIPVDSKNLPRIGEGCLLAGIEYWKSEKNRRPFVQYGYRVGDGWRSGGGGTIDPEREQVTHWMDFPNPPAIRSLKQSNAVAEDEGPCADCGRPKSDSAMHLDSPGKGWGAALHWFKQSNSGMAGCA